jgi:hypothetical protein
LQHVVVRPGQQVAPQCAYGGSQHTVPFRQFAMLAQQVPPHMWSGVQQVLPKPHTSPAAQHVSPQSGPVLSAGQVMQTTRS